MSIEWYFIVSFLTDLGILAAAAVRARGVRAKRVFMGAFAGALGASAAAWMKWTAAFWPPLLCLSLSLCVMLGGRKARVWMRTAAWTAAATLLTAGLTLSAAAWLKLSAPWTAIGAALVTFIAACLAPRPESSDVHETPVRITTRMGTAEVTAMIDTGNRLREPFSDLPVLIVSGRCLTTVIDAVCMDEREILPPGFRVVRYRVLGGGGYMRCFRPERISTLKGREWIDAPDMWVAIYPGSIPGGLDALAPPAVCGGEDARAQSGRR